MAEEATKQQKPADNKNWADMDNDEEEEQEIGVQGATTTAAANTESKEEEKKETSAATTEEGDKQGAKGYGKRPRKDYGDKYDPNYKKKIWSKGGAQFPNNKNIAPAIARSKNERGDYVVTSFVIPDRADKAKAQGADKVNN
jgi:hypothetical protein